MSAHITSFWLGEPLKNFLTKEVNSGRYKSRSEVIRAALCLLERDAMRKRARRLANGKKRQA